MFQQFGIITKNILFELNFFVFSLIQLILLLNIFVFMIFRSTLIEDFSPLSSINECTTLKTLGINLEFLIFNFQSI